MNTIFELSSAGEAELRRGVTDLSAIELELLVRLDGATPVGEVRSAMLAATDAQFAAALQALERQSFVRERQPDPFEAQMRQQLHLLGVQKSPAKAQRGVVRGGSFAVGLARRRPVRVGPPRALSAVVVEDEPALAHFVDCFLSLEGFEVRLAANRAEVIAAIRQGVPDVVLLDGSLPDVDGLQVLRSLRQNPQLRHVPVLMMTGRASREAVLEALTAGADGYLTKPVDAEAMVTAVRAVVGLPDGSVVLGSEADPPLPRSVAVPI